MQYLTHLILFCFQILRPVYQDNQGTLGKTGSALGVHRSCGRSWKENLRRDCSKSKIYSPSLVLFTCFTSCFIQQPGCTQRDRPLAHSPRAAAEGPPPVAPPAVEAVSPAAQASFVGLTTPRLQRRRPRQLTPRRPTTLSRMLTLQITRTVLLSARTLHTATMVTSKWHPRSWFSLYLFR